MKYKFIPVILTAALTSILTLFVAAHYQNSFSLFSANNHQLPVNYASYTEGGTTMKSGMAPVDFQPAAEASVKAVVHIKTATKVRRVVADNPFAQLFGDDFGGQEVMMQPAIGSGSGVVISPDGYIVTNNHVVAGAEEMTVTFNDRYTTKAKVVATDPATDIALIKVDEKNLPYMEFGNSDDVHLGQWVMAVGYPLTLDATVTAGIVSAKGRSLGINRTNSTNPIEAFIQTDAAVNPGNSGGALVNTNGQVIGINSAIASPTGSYAGYSYAIPSNIVKKVVGDLMKYGSVQRGYMGIGFMDYKSATPEQLKQLGIDRNDGVYVNTVAPNSGAQKAGITKGDFITSINGVATHTGPELMEQVARYKPGDNISVVYARGGKTYNTTIELKNIDGTTSIVKEESATRLLGASFRNLTSAEKSKMGVDGGVMVTDLGSGALAKQTRMHKGFVITNINDNAVNSIDDLQQSMAMGGQSGVQIGGFYPGSNGMYYYGLNNGNGTASNDQ